MIKMVMKMVVMMFCGLGLMFVGGVFVIFFVLDILSIF